MTRSIGVVPVRVGRSVVPVSVEAEEGAKTHVDYSTKGTRIVVSDELSPDVASREVEAILPEVQKLLARKILN
jgi:hypothetical protein